MSIVAEGKMVQDVSGVALNVVTGQAWEFSETAITATKDIFVKEGGKVVSHVQVKASGVSGAVLNAGIETMYSAGEVIRGKKDVVDVCSMNQNREFIYKRIGAKVAYFRISNGLTQEEMAARVHLSRSTLSKIEHGNYNRSISLDLLLDIADGLGIDLSMLFVLDRDEKDYWESVNGIELK